MRTDRWCCNRYYIHSCTLVACILYACIKNIPDHAEKQSDLGCSVGDGGSDMMFI